LIRSDRYGVDGLLEELALPLVGEAQWKTGVLSFYVGANAHETGVHVPAGNGRFAAATRDDLAAAHAAILSGEGHEKKSYSLTGDPAISFSGIAHILAGITGKDVPYVAISDEEYLKKIGTGVPDFVATFVLEWVRNMNAGEWEERAPDLEKLIGHKPTTATEFFRDHYLPSAGH
jgi:NAD(P)H dehydrogenase (quinone)